MHDAVPVRDTHHRIGFEPPQQPRPVSSLPLINPGSAAVEVNIEPGHTEIPSYTA